jgi:hypothetical protein
MDQILEEIFITCNQKDQFYIYMCSVPFLLYTLLSHIHTHVLWEPVPQFVRFCLTTGLS